ncbi:hypothetical protein ACFPTO_17705 [Paraburkholderia denitrificans]|uniref:Entericidin n=1 Tax=Paraburkholderia denitrificans TaxID=694025 RepID=A0ABW0JC87_9BURK
MIKRCVAIALLAGTVFSLAGCNTIAGFGQDITGSARAVQRII